MSKKGTVKVEGNTISGTAEDIIDVFQKAGRKGSRSNPVTTDEMEKVASGESLRPYIIKEASLKDGYCNYRFEITEGTGAGDTHKVDGSGLYEDDLRFSFGRFNVHMAYIDDVFKHSDIEVDDINNYHGHEHAHLYNTTGFKIAGSKHDESVVLIGTKYVSCAGGRIEIKTPKIPLDNLSSYPWYTQLREAVDIAREEVSLYKEGKYTVEEEPEDEEINARQMTIDQNVEMVDDGEGEEDGEDFNEYLHK